MAASVVCWVSTESLKGVFVKQNKKGAKQQFSKMETGMMMVHNFKGIAQGKPTGDPLLPSIFPPFLMLLSLTGCIS